MLNQIKALLSDTQLIQQIKNANSLSEILLILRIADIEKGVSLSKENISQLLHMHQDAIGLSEEDLLLVSGGGINNIPGMTNGCNTNAACNTNTDCYGNMYPLV